MFETEAEEYAKKKFSSFVKGIREIARISFKNGAEFGYNKANEWHYVKDGDLPKEIGLLMSKTLLLVTKMKGSDCLSLALGEYNFRHKSLVISTLLDSQMLSLGKKLYFQRRVYET